MIARVLIAIFSLILIGTAACGADGSDDRSVSGTDPTEPAAGADHAGQEQTINAGRVVGERVLDFSITLEELELLLSTVREVLGGEGLWPILLGAVVGAPAYLNGFATVPLVDALLAQGMSNGAAMSFVIAGGVSCIPAAIAVWALVKRRVFAAYLGIAFVGSILAGLAWSVIA